MKEGLNSDLFFPLDPSLVDQIAELQKNLEEKEASLSSDKKWLWNNDPIREKRARLGFEKVEFPSLESMTNEQWQAFKADSRVTTSLSPFSLLNSSNISVCKLCCVLV